MLSISKLWKTPTQRNPASYTYRSLSRFTQQGWPQPFTKVLIANRGEIACRVIDTCNTLNIKTVAVFSEIDSQSQHVLQADEAILLGPAPATQSYLDISKIIKAALATGAQAIHPGYGFLSENVTFAQQCADNGIVFIGPPIPAIASMGSKSASKRIMEEAGVPVVPGYHGENQDPEYMYTQAVKVGFPVMLKAVLGGGGKGMRIVRGNTDKNKEKKLFLESLEGCKREAMASFSDDKVLLERYIEKPRHIEFQVFSDSLGNCVHYWERDCSVQRRHQKVLEEAPAPLFTEEERESMGRAAVDAAKAVGYQGAGTVEFIVDAENGEFFFMEMNTRLQVEHPISEMITRQDFVQLQLHVAAGHGLPLKQNEIVAQGHAIEARVYAEDPWNGFLPASGRIGYMKVPEQNKGVRVDSGVVEGDEISIFYDPMISKLVVWANNRDNALEGISRALGEYKIRGLPTNIEFLRNAVGHSNFIKGKVDTGFIAQNESDLLKKGGGTSLPLQSEYLAGLVCILDTSESTSNSIWESGYRVSASIPGKRVVSLEGGKEMVYSHTGACLYEVDGHTLKITPSDSRDTITVLLDNYHSFKVGYSIQDKGRVVSLFHEGNTYSHRLRDTSGDGVSSAVKSGTVHPPMPGKIVSVVVQEGQIVDEGDILLVMEAMKMEHTLRAPSSGKVVSLEYQQGDFVDPSTTLLVIEPLSKD